MGYQRCYGCMRKKFTNPICRYCKDDAGKPNPPYQLAAGSMLKGRYFIGRAIGQGGFGITYIGWDLNGSSRIAVKECFLSGVVIRDAKVSSEVKTADSEANGRFASQKERFLREYKVLSGLSDIPGLVQIKDFFEENNTAYIVMEYVEGITLRQYVEKQGGKLSGKEAFEILGQVMQSLAKVHDAGLVHRDISPDNLMVLGNGSVKLLDFGTVREVSGCAVGKPLTMATEAIIKRGYAPLEQYQSKGSLGPWTDVYALCATAFYCLTGKEPPEAIERLMQDKPVLFRANGADVSEYEEGVLLKGMELRTHDRISDMEKLYDALFRFGHNGNMRKENMVRRSRMALHRRKFRWLLLSVAAILLCVASVSGYRNMQLTGNKVIAIPLYFKEQIEEEYDFNTWFNIRGTVEAYSDSYTLSCNIYLPKKAFKEEPLCIWIHSRLDIGGDGYDGGTADIIHNLRLFYDKDEIFLVPDDANDVMLRQMKKEGYYQLYDAGDYYKVAIRDFPYCSKVHFGEGDEVMAPIDTSRGGELALNINLSASGQEFLSVAYLDDIILKDNGSEVYSFECSRKSLYGYEYFCNYKKPDGGQEETRTLEIEEIYVREALSMNSDAK